MNDKILDNDYIAWLKELKYQIRNSQVKAALAINSQLVLLYWDLGRQIVEKQTYTKWGSHLIDQLSRDLKAEFPSISGFSRSNLYSIKKFYLFHNQADTFVQQAAGQLASETVQQAAGQIPDIIQLCARIPGYHNILIIEKASNYQAAIFYIKETIENNWSRAVLEYQIETTLYSRQGKILSNFKNTLPTPSGDLAQAIFKNPYNFEFLSLTRQAVETELEDKLIRHITQFLLELGKGFAYMGKQFLLKIGNKDYRIDLLFYHTKLKSYIIIELKLKEFEPEFIGKLNFYISAINELVKQEDDNPTIGILLCKNQDNYEVEFALKDINKPIGVSEFTYNEIIKEIRDALPELDKFNNDFNNKSE